MVVRTVYRLVQSLNGAKFCTTFQYFKEEKLIEEIYF